MAWGGSVNHMDAVRVSAVLRSWEDRFGARLVTVGSAEINLSVAAPPTTIEHARHVAAEHLAFCPDNVSDSLEEYARTLIDARSWWFWWD